MKSQHKNIAVKAIVPLLILMAITSCKKFVEVPAPQTTLSNTAIFNTDKGANSAELEIYYRMAYQENCYVSLFPSLSSDEWKNYSTDNNYIQLYQNSMASSNTYTLQLWAAAYQFIEWANAVLEGVNSSKGISAPVKQQLIGEAEFIRSYWYFYLVNLYGDVPLITSTSYQKSESASRTPKAQVFQQIIRDLTDAEMKLNSDFVEADGVTSNATTERLRPTKAAAEALLARTYLYNNDWTNAETQAGLVINNPSFMLVGDLNSVFFKNSKEAIWQIARPSFNSFVGICFNINYIPPGGYTFIPGAMSDQLFTSFEPTDARKTNWISQKVWNGVTYNYVVKYKGFANIPPFTDYEMILRLAEQYLIRAEARAQQNKMPEAITDLNIIRNRAGLANYSGATDKASVLNAIAHERQVELFTEGHRWLDLKRTGTIDNVMSAVAAQKGSTWNSSQQLYPIPASEIAKDANLTQNPGY